MQKLSDFVEYTPQKIHDLYWKYREEDILKAIFAYAGIGFIIATRNLFANPTLYVYVASVIFIAVWTYWIWRVSQ